MKIKRNDKEYYKDLAKDISMFTAGVIIGPVIDFAQLVKKHGPILHKKMSEKINRNIRFYKEVK